MADAAITITFKIHDNTATGTVVYEENHTATTNAQGLISLNVGGGSVVSGTFSGINWGSGNKFLHVLMNAGSGVVDLGTQQMMSVPYSLHSEKANNINVSISNSGDTLFLGESSFVIIPGINSSNLMPGNYLGGDIIPELLSCYNYTFGLSGCGGQDTVLYYDEYYAITEIDGQCWFLENLNTTKFSNGDLIPLATNGTANYNPTWLSGDQNYAKIYNNFVADDSRNVCPTGWHVPTDCDWFYLESNTGKIPKWKLEDISNRECLPGIMPALNFNGLSSTRTITSAYSQDETYWVGQSGGMHRAVGSSSVSRAYSSGSNLVFRPIRCIKD
jgi:uncharacterized protein (TIGR02145 family)